MKTPSSFSLGQPQVTLIADTESDGFLDVATRIWTIQIGDAATDEVTIYADQPGFPPLADGLARLSAADRVVFHNGIGFDFWLIEKFYPGTLRQDQIFDTLVAARLAHPDNRFHSLDDWGDRLRCAKGKYGGDFSAFDDALVTYARQDIVVGRALYNAVKHVEEWGMSCWLEHRVAWIINAQERNGFGFDVAAAQALEIELRGDLADTEKALQKVFLPKRRQSTFIPKCNNKTRGYVAGEPVVKEWDEPFNPGSREHVAEWLQDFGWVPVAFGAERANGKKVPTVDDEVLSAIALPEARHIAKYFKLQKMLGQLSDGKNGWLKLVREDGRLYGRVNPNGAVTGRMSHFSPNVAQASKKDPRMRAVFVPRRGWVLVGCDAEGIEGRALASYLRTFDGGALIEAIINGSKADETDMHSVNKKGVNGVGYPVNRDGAKTILYALIYGAQDEKLGWTVCENLRDIGADMPREGYVAIGRKVRAALMRSMKGLKELTDLVKERIRSRGYIIGIDGRHIPIRAFHAALNTLLQGCGAVIMKLALVLFWDEMHDRGYVHGRDFGLCANVHDEVQIETTPELAPLVGELFAEAIKVSGVILKLPCPFAGASEIGNNWAETH